MNKSLKLFTKLIGILDELYVQTKHDDLGMILGTLDPPFEGNWSIDESVKAEWNSLVNTFQIESRELTLSDQCLLSETFIDYLVNEFHLDFSNIRKKITERISEELKWDSKVKLR